MFATISQDSRKTWNRSSVFFLNWANNWLNFTQYSLSYDGLMFKSKFLLMVKNPSFQFFNLWISIYTRFCSMASLGNPPRLYPCWDSMGKWNSIHRKYRTFVDSGDDLDLSVLTLDRCGTFVSQNGWDDEPKMDLGWLRYEMIWVWTIKKMLFFCKWREIRRKMEFHTFWTWKQWDCDPSMGVSSHAWCMTWTSFSVDVLLKRCPNGKTFLVLGRRLVNLILLVRKLRKLAGWISLFWRYFERPRTPPKRYKAQESQEMNRLIVLIHVPSWYPLVI